MRLALCGGGTGGHVYPALVIADALRRELPAGAKLELLYLGAQEGAEVDLMQRADIPLHLVSSGPIRGRNPLELTRNAARMTRGVRQARRALSEFGAQAVLSTGGYASFPVAMAARSRRIPIVLYLPDVYPGWAARAIARLAHRIAATAPESMRRLPGAKTIVTGYPVREEFSQVSRPEARQRLGLDPEEKVLFVAGASQGAHSINQAVAENLRSLLELCEVIHISGRDDEEWLAGLANELPDKLRPRYHLFGYLHEEFPWAMAAADLALCRAGASVLGELPAVGLPGSIVYTNALVKTRSAGGMVSTGSWAWIEITDSRLFKEGPPASLVASLFVNEDTYLALANYGAPAVTVTMNDLWQDRQSEARGKTWTLPARTMKLLRRIASGRVGLS